MQVALAVPDFMPLCASTGAAEGASRTVHAVRALRARGAMVTMNIAHKRYRALNARNGWSIAVFG